jgi:cytochrome b561
MLIYLELLVQPVLGFLASNAWGAPIVWFGIVKLPSPIGANEKMADLLSTLHDNNARVLLALIVVHLAGAAWHGLVRRDGIVRRML